MKNRPNMQQQNNAMAAQGQGQGQGQQPQQVPQGPMQGGPGQVPRPAPNQMPFRMPTQQDLEKLRATNPALENVSDDQIRGLVISRHRQQMQKQTGAQGAAQQMQFMPSQGGPAPAPNQQFAMQAPAQNQASGQASMQAQQQAQQQPRPSQTPGQPESRALKRPNADVTEIPNPAANKQTRPPGDANKTSGTQSLTKEQYEAMDPAKRQQYMNFQRQQMAMRKVVELTKEVQTSMPKLRPITNMDAASRKRIAMILTSENVKNMLGRFDSFLIAFYRIDANEAAIKQLILQKMQLFSQFKPQALQSRTFELNDHFSVTADAAEAIINNITAKFQQTAAQIPHQNKPRPQQALLTPENLSLLEAQEQERKRSLKANQAPPAPTSTEPPFQIGAHKDPHGAPRYATPGLKQEDLKLPADPKRRKKNQQTAAAATPTTPAVVTTSPTATKAPKPADVFKCPVQGCEHQLKGFATQAELDQHHNVAHKLEMEPVTDPLAFLHESLRSAFNLDENLKQIKKPLPKSESKPTNIKGENDSATPSAMSQIPSQGAGVGTTTKAGATTTSDEGDPWMHSNISLDQLRVAFGGDEWEELLPSPEKLVEQQSRFYEAYRHHSERWRKIVEGPNGALTDTSTEKSKSPAVSDKDASAGTAATSQDHHKPASQGKKSDDDAWVVNLDGIDGLDLSGLSNMSPFETIGDRDVVMGGDDGSPFETVERPRLSTEELHLQHMGVDLAHPDRWTDQDRALAEFLLET
jgi:hypothetical protein